VLKFINGSLKCSRIILRHDPRCLDDVRVSGKIGNLFLMTTELVHQTQLQLVQSDTMSTLAS
jgi:hypothetical protein